MGRQRDPIDCELPFTYWVFGRPISIRNDDGSRPKALGAWRKDIEQAVVVAISDATKDRGFNLVEGVVEVRIIWLSTNTRDAVHPDVDNIMKPLIDALNKRVIRDDINVHRILAEKADINYPPPVVSVIYPEIQEDPEFRRLSEVTVVRVFAFNQEYQP